jgi:hypothetical protein
VRNLARLQVLVHVEHEHQHLEYNYCSLLSISEHISSNTLAFNWLIGQNTVSRQAAIYGISQYFLTVLIVDENFSIAQQYTWKMEHDFVTINN